VRFSNIVLGATTVQGTTISRRTATGPARIAGVLVSVVVVVGRILVVARALRGCARFVVLAIRVQDALIPKVVAARVNRAQAVAFGFAIVGTTVFVFVGTIRIIMVKAAFGKVNHGS